MPKKKNLEVSLKQLKCSRGKQNWILSDRGILHKCVYNFLFNDTLKKLFTKVLEVIKYLFYFLGQEYIKQMTLLVSISYVLQ